MKTWIFAALVALCIVSAFMGLNCGQNNMDGRFLQVARYVSEHCAGSVAYDSLPSRYTRALEMGRDSVRRFLEGLEQQIGQGKCPE